MSLKTMVGESLCPFRGYKNNFIFHYLLYDGASPNGCHRDVVWRTDPPLLKSKASTSRATAKGGEYVEL